MTTNDVPPVIQTADAVAQACVATWDALTGAGELLMQGQVQQAWTSLSSTIATCWSQALTAMQSALPILG